MGKPTKTAASSASSAGTPSRWQAVDQAGTSQAYWGNVVVPDWLLGLQAQLPEELRDPDLEEMARAQPVGRSPIRRGQTFRRIRSVELRARPEWRFRARPPRCRWPPLRQEDADDWLQGLLSATKSTEAGPATPVTATGEEKLPDWLTDLRSTMYEKTAADSHRARNEAGRKRAC